VGFLLKEWVGYSRDFTFDESLVQVAEDLSVSRLRGVISLTRTPQGLYAEGRLRAAVQVECVRCLTETEQPLGSHISDLFFYPPETAPEGALTVGDDVHLDLAPIVREDMFVSRPMRALCRPECKGLCPTCGQNWNEAACDCEDEQVDPRMAVLTHLLKEAPR
jgi:uncharacterized protein